MKILTAFCLMLIANIVIAQDEISVIEIDVKPYMGLTYDAYFKHLTIRSEEERAVEYVSGFEYEWGYEYRLKVKKTMLEIPPEDASDRTYDLIEILSKTAVSADYTFKLSIEKDMYLGPGEQETTLVLINDSTYLYMDEIKLIISPSLRVPFLKTINAGVSYNGLFEFIDNSSLRMLK